MTAFDQVEQYELLNRDMMSWLRVNAPALYWARRYHKNDRGEPMVFDDVPYLVSLYRMISDSPNFCCEKCVQIGISELFIIESHREAGEMGLSVMYVLPKYEIRNRFVNNRVYKLHQRCEHYSKLLKESKSTVHRTSLMHFGKGTLMYVGSNVADEFVEAPIDSAYVDEKDRCNQENLLLLPDRYTRSPYKFHREVSNPSVEGFGIDERYQESSKGLWNIKCQACGEWFVPDFFQHIVQQISDKDYRPRDTRWKAIGDKIELIHNCGAVVNRVEYENAQWVFAYPGRTWVGVRVGQIISRFVSLESMYKKWMDAIGNPMKVQIFYNSVLGLPYSSKGAKITRIELLECERQYVLPLGNTKNPRICGIDVGVELHYVVREIVKENNVECRRLVEVGRVPTFELMQDVFKRVQPRVIVIDADPEIHKVQEFKTKFTNVYSSRFHSGLYKINVNRGERHITMDRTALLDSVYEGVSKQISLLPVGSEFLDNGMYYEQMQASTRIVEVNEENPDKSKYVWAHSKPDHYFLAEAYCLQASILLPSTGLYDFYTSQLGIQPIPGSEDLTDDQRKEIERLQTVDQNSVLDGLQKQYAKWKGEGK